MSTTVVPAQRTSIFQAAGASTIGTIVEWYDFYLYGTAAALVLNRCSSRISIRWPASSPPTPPSPSASWCARSAVVIFAHFSGDRFGRKPC